MRTRPLARQRGATRLELAVATILATLLAGVLLNCLIRYQVESERVASKQLIASLRTALAVQSAKVISATGEAGLIALLHENPMAWLQNQPKNYLGEYYLPKKESIEGAGWYFDRGSHTLVHLPAVEKSFSPGTQKVEAFKVKLVRVSTPVSAVRRETGNSGLVLEQLDDQAIAFHLSAGFLPRLTLSEKK